jgi:hypothetical protein
MSVAKIKKMGKFLWLIRGVSDYVEILFREYITFRRQGLSGCIEFLFDSSEELEAAIRAVESLPVVGETIFHTIPGAPTYQEAPDGVPVTMRTVSSKRKRRFMNAVDGKMAFSKSDPTGRTRPNLNDILNMAGPSEQILVVCVSIRLEDTTHTHSYDYLFKGLSWSPEDSTGQKRVKA